MDILSTINQSQIENLVANKEMPEIFPGDTVKVKVKVGERSSFFEGLCIAKRNRGVNSSFTLRKVSYGEGVERVFPLYSPNLQEIKILKRGRVRRAKLYFIRKLRGKKARIAESTTGYKAKI